jgi:hypothetical protein
LVGVAMAVLVAGSGGGAEREFAAKRGESVRDELVVVVVVVLVLVVMVVVGSDGEKQTF